MLKSFANKPRYTPLKLESDPDLLDHRFYHKQRWSWTNYFLFFLSWTITFLTLIYHFHFSNKTTNPIFPQALFSPAQSVFSYELKVFTVGLGGAPPTKYQAPPSLELDAEWNALYDFLPSQIPKDQAVLLPNTTSTIPGDDSSYVLHLDVFHQLHCLNMIRKALSLSYYDATDPEWSHLLSEKHTSHCIGYLRQSLMCASDITPIVWTRDEENKLRPEGRVIHTCRNFEAIRQWAKDNQIGQNADLSQFVNM